ncbi:MAG: heavy metal transporter [Methylocystaceae bacterium]|nr:MAG: heavy metal transporter [Methylocystaceae bacterium]
MGESNLSFHARGMHCHGCEHIIEVSVSKLPGVSKVKADYPTEMVTVAFDPALTNIDEIRAAIEQQGYRFISLDDAKRRRTFPKLAGLILGLAGILLIILLDTEWISQGGVPDISQHMSLQLIFVLGLLTGFHCIGMCGGFVLSYTAADTRTGRRSYLSHLLYGAGKTLSYTSIGAMFGLFGAVVAFTPMLRGVAGMLAGVFLIVFGLNMLGLFAPLRRFRLGLPAPLQAFVYERQVHSRHRPFVIGLLNGLMIACGPLQAMYVMAAGTGSAFEGAKMLFSFGVGTLPVLMSFGVLTTLISGSLTHRLLKFSGVIVVVLGAVMINRGLILTGSGYDLRSIVTTLSRTSKLSPGPQSPAPAGRSQPTSTPATTPQPTPMPAARPAFQTITMDVIRSGFSPNHFVLIKGVPARWIINGKQITTCNHRIIVPSLNLEFDVKKGRQVIEFTPDKTGVISWSCWMGMLRGEFEVIDEPTATIEQTPIAPAASATSGKRTTSVTRMHDNVYTIVAGDSLRSIAIKLYHDAHRWRGIAATNPGLDPRRLRPGQVIKLSEPIGNGDAVQENR